MYDAIVVGARCAGSPTARLLAKRGYQVLLIDKSEFPSDTISTHYLHMPAVAKLRKWGLLDDVLATGCPPIKQITYSLGGIGLTGMCPPWDGETWGIAPRRSVLDHLLIEAAGKAGAEVRQATTGDEVIASEGRIVGVRSHCRSGQSHTDMAKIVIGADGLNSFVAKAVRAEEYGAEPASTAVWYSYWDGVDLDHLILGQDSGCEIFAVPTNNGLVNVLVGVKNDQFRTFRANAQQNYLEHIEKFPMVAARILVGHQVEPLYGTRNTQQWFRKPYGSGWALVGDAGHLKDPIAGIGISDAFRQADVLAEAIDAGLSGRRRLDLALAEYHAWRDQVSIPIFEYTTKLARLDGVRPELRAVLRAIKGDEKECARFFGLFGGFTSHSEYFSTENLRKILTSRRTAAAGVAG